MEVTESATMADPDRAVEVLCALRDRGVGVSIDDFGTGNASIAYLTSLPANEIKIDRSFVTEICEDERAEAITRSTIDLARPPRPARGRRGDRDAADLERLTALGCNTGQGYLIARPLAPQDFLEWLAAKGNGPARPPSGAPRGAAVVGAD